MNLNLSYVFIAAAVVVVAIVALRPAQEVIREVPVETAAEPPEDLAQSKELWDRVLNAEYTFTPDEVLRRVPSVAVRVSLNEALQRYLPESAVLTSFENALRRFGIAVDGNSVFTINLDLSGTLQPVGSGNLLLVSIAADLNQMLLSPREAEDKTMTFQWVNGSIWKQGSFGALQLSQVNAAAFDPEIEEIARVFAAAVSAARAAPVAPAAATQE
jgi:hypothetical protein